MHSRFSNIRVLVQAALFCGGLLFLSCQQGNKKQKQQVFTASGYRLQIRNEGAPANDLPQKLATVFFARYPVFCKKFNPRAPKALTVVLDDQPDSLALGASSKGFIRLNINGTFGNTGQLSETFCHELMHQVLFNNNAESWLVEGLADYGNYYYGATTHAWRTDSFSNTPRSGIYWYSGYQHTAKFLMWLDTQFPGFTDSLIKASLRGTYKKGTYFIEKTNKTPEQLWAVYRESSFKQEQIPGTK